MSLSFFFFLLSNLNFHYSLLRLLFSFGSEAFARSLVRCSLSCSVIMRRTTLALIRLGQRLAQSSSSLGGAEGSGSSSSGIDMIGGWLPATTPSMSSALSSFSARFFAADAGAEGSKPENTSR